MYNLPDGTPAEALVTSQIAYDAFDDMFKFKSEQQKMRDGFAGTALDTTKWTVVKQGSGQTITVSGGTLTISAGTNANDELIIQSNQAFTIPCRLWASMMLSQRIANQDFWIELISVDANGNPDGKHAAAWHFNGTANNNGIYEVQYGGQARLQASVTLALNTSAYAIREIELFNDEAWFHERTPDSTSGRSSSWVRHQQIPDPNSKYVVRIHVLNGATAPASNTNLTLNFIGVYDYTELTTEVTGGRGSTNSGSAENVYVSGGTLTANLSSNISDLGNITTTNLGANGTYTSSSYDGGSARGYGQFRVGVLHQAGVTHGHLVVQQSTDNSTWRETARVPIPSDGQHRTFNFPWVFRYLRVLFYNGSTAQTAFFLGGSQIRVDGGPFDQGKKLDFIDSTTPLGASGTFNGVALNLGTNHYYIRHRVGLFADQPCTLQLQQSRDGSTWRTVAQTTSTANQFVSLEAPIQFQYVRVVATNTTSTACTVTEITSTLLSD